MILLAAVGYQYLGDLSFGPLLGERLEAHELPANVQVEDLSFGPIAVVQWFQDHPDRFDHAVFLGSVIRGRPPGTLTISEWEQGRQAPELVQERVAEAVTGVINLENTLMICDHFDVLPDRVSVIDLEPIEVNWNEPLSRWARVRLNEAEQWLERAIEEAPSPASTCETEAGVSLGARPESS